ncbi:unnamed protein product, partial [Durusdinium trenchii]
AYQQLEGSQVLWELRRWYHRSPYVDQLPLFHRVRRSQDVWLKLHGLLLKPKRQASGDDDADRFLNVGDDGQDCAYAVPICLFCAMLVWDAIGAARADDNASFY